MKLPMAVATAVLTGAAVLVSRGNSTHLVHPDYSLCQEMMRSGNNNNTMEHVFWNPSSSNNAY